MPKGIEDLVSQPRGPVLTVHPLGGCRIGSDADQGVVDTWGRVNLVDGSGGLQTWVLELTLAFRAQAVSTLAGRVREPMQLKPEDSRLRLYKAEQWDEFVLKAADDSERVQFAEIEASLYGSLRFFHRQASAPWLRKLRGLWAYGLNRGLRDLWQRSHEPLRHDELRKTCLSILTDGGDFLDLASRNGQRRLFEYELHIDQILTPSAAAPSLLKTGDKLAGHKLLGYARRASPWTQLTEMHLTRFPGLPPDGRPKLTLDARFLAKQGKPLLHIEQQQDHASALADLMSFGMSFARVLLDAHFELPHERAFRQTGMRAVMQRMPVFMMLGDHELFDNWQPLPDALLLGARRRLGRLPRLAGRVVAPHR